MNAIHISMIVIIVVVLLTTISLVYKRKKDRLVELDCTFYISDNIDALLDNYKEQTSVEIDGILGNDFMAEHSYIIDYEKLVVRHKSVRISIKDAVDIMELPLIVLWHKSRKYIFLLDTGATSSLIHSRCKETLEYVENTDDAAEIYGYGGKGEASTSISTKLYYSKENIRGKMK